MRFQLSSKTSVYHIVNIMSMQKIVATSPEAKSAEITADNIAKLTKLFPELLTETSKGLAISVDVLKQIVGDATVTEVEEKYGLNWHGKRRARQMALTPSNGTLRPCPEESVDWATTKNLLIEGDNLEVLKLLQKSYAGKVKMIYIDPPYNTGKDFVYPDNFQNGIKSYLEITVQTEGSLRLTSNAESSGRFHTDWLSMMYPRLKLARNLLQKNGLIFISIDDSEASNLKKICDEIFGEECFISMIVWEKMYTTKNDAANFSACHEYLLVYGKNIDEIDVGLLPRSAEMDARYTNPDNDPRGPWKAIPLYAQGESKNGRYPVVSPMTGKAHFPPPDSHWRFVQSETERLIADNQISFGKEGSSQPNIKRYLTDVQQGTIPKTLWKHSEVGSNDSAKRELRDLYGDDKLPFDFPKPTTLIERLITLSNIGDGDIVLDFFAGSGTTGHATMLRNLTGAKSRFILVQLPEPLSESNKEQTTAFEFCKKLNVKANIAELTKDRLRRTSKKLKDSGLMGDADLGFRVQKLDTSNIRPWNIETKELANSLLEHTEHIVEGRSDADIVQELLLKLGLDLCVESVTREISGNTINAIGNGVLLSCLSESIATKEVESLAMGILEWHKELLPVGETTCVFRDSAFENDVAKSNMAAILEQHGIAKVRSL